ncbi:hypothetical protein Dip510_001576 [Elusimicrobium posterum]|uniref:hypothetical protein n=1 Tax=Elusimicrobium posterum TaxID=3116653 RepID=UPI003C714E35
MKLNLEDIRALAATNGWAEVDLQENICMISFKRDKQRVNVYFSKATVGTAIDHPKKGKTQLFRRNVTPKLLEKIFNNTRVHTGKGYYKKKENRK